MRASLLAAACAACLSTAPAFAQDSAASEPLGSERRLTPEQIEAVLAEAAAKQSPAASQSIQNLETPPPPQIHGEVGFAVGTGGFREAFGSAIYPMGNHGAAAISLNFIDWGHRRYGE